MKFQDDFVKNLKFYRKEKHISQERLAELCDCATSTIGCIESYNQLPSFEMIEKIATALNIHTADLFFTECFYNRFGNKGNFENSAYCSN
jgi:transcriptional regulator with XRE-family HTH domain